MLPDAMIPSAVYRRIVDNQNTTLLLFDDELRLNYLNPAGEMLFAVSARRANRILAQELLPGPMGEVAITAMRGALASGHPFTEHEFPLLLPGGSAGHIQGRAITVDFTVTPVSDMQATGLLVELVQVDRHLRIAREENLLAQHQAARAVVRGLAHEIKNPLGGLRGAAQLLERELSDESLKEYTRIIIGEADRLRNLVNRMLGPNTLPQKTLINIHHVLERVRSVVLAGASTDALDRAPVDARNVMPVSDSSSASLHPLHLGIRAGMHNQRQDAESGLPGGSSCASLHSLHLDILPGVRIIRDYDPSIPDFQADQDQLIQAVLNIVRNAVQSIGTAGDITLRTRIQRQATINQQRYKLAVRIDIVDNGPGIPADMLESIFYPMVTGRPEGTGLGLSIAQSLINQHQGLIECTSRPGQTIFTLLLPLA